MTHQNIPHSWSLGKGSLLPREEMLEVSRKSKKFVIGLPREMNGEESRLGLTPEAVELLVDNGHEVLVENKAGKGANYSDTDYSECGGQIINGHSEVFKRSDIVLKVTPPTERETDTMKKGQLLISSMVPRQQKEEFFRSLMKARATCISFELFRNNDNSCPVVRSMSEIAGGASILIAAEYLSNQNDGKGIILGGITGITPTEVVILGAGTASEFAARAALGMGAFVKVFDHSVDRLRSLQDKIGQRLYTSVFHPRVMSKALKSADVVIGAIDINNERSVYFVTENMVREMKSGSVIVDLALDQGGCIETSERRTHKSPVFIKHGVVHYCVPNIPSRVARTASIALSNIFAPLLLAIGESGGIKQLILDNMGLRKSVYVYNGLLTNSSISKMFDIPSSDIDLLMAAF